jgi:hypothetical protein
VTTTGNPIDYDALTQEAMRGLVRSVLARVVRQGLPGDHHFYIAFDTRRAGVSLSKRLREKYPEEMTIVLQHRFWDLVVSDDRFEVKLTFDGIAERLVVPFAAMRVFYDPSVPFGLQFEDASGRRQTAEGDPAIDGARGARRVRPGPEGRSEGRPERATVIEASPARPVGEATALAGAGPLTETTRNGESTPVGITRRRERTASQRSRGEANEQGGSPVLHTATRREGPPPATPTPADADKALEQQSAATAPASPPEEAPAVPAKVVSLDAFRKR